MLDSKILDRARRLIQIGFQERQKNFPNEIAQKKEKMVGTGNLYSGHFLQTIHNTCAQEVAIRAKIVLENIVRAHKAVGSPLTETLAADIKEEGSHFIEKITEEVGEKMAREMHFMKREAQHYNLSSAKYGATQEMNIEADLYVDSLAVESKNLGSANTGAKTIFISHANEDAILAEIIKTQIDNVFEKKIKVFVSSIPGTISPGSDWFDKILGNLTGNNAFIVLVTPYSEKRPFVWFEIGFSWLRRLNKNCEIYAICVPPINHGNLPEPLCRLQAISLADKKQTKAFFTELIKQFSLGNLNNLEFTKICDSLPTYLSQITQTENIGLEVANFDDTDKIEISDEAKELLVEASKSSDGIIMKLGTNQGLIVKINNRNYVSENDPRSEAIWRDAVKQLYENDMIEDKGYKGEVFAITRKGYECADKIKQTENQ